MNSSLDESMADSEGIKYSCLDEIKILKGFKIASLNINSLLKHIDELRLILTKSEIDVFAINETKIDIYVTDNEINIPGYTVIRRDRNRFGGGVAVYIREVYSFCERKDLNVDCLEMISIEICKPRNKAFLISAWYRPPNSEIELFNAFEIFLSKCDDENKDLLVIGDINCNMLKSPQDSNTKKLVFLSALYNLEQLIKEPTRITNTSSTLIDLIFTNQPNNISNSGVIDLGMSDHSLIYAVRKIIMPKYRQVRSKVRNFKRFNDNDFVQELSAIPWYLITQCVDPNNSWQIWKSFFLECLDRHAPLIYKSIKQNSIPWINSDIKKLMRSRDFHKKRAKKYNSQIHWDKFKSKRNKVNSEIKKAKIVYYQTKFSELSLAKDMKKTWSLVNTLLGKGGKSSNIAEININGNIYNQCEHIAEHLNDYFINIGPTLAAESACSSDYDELLHNLTDVNSQFKFHTITESNILKHLKNLKVSKATGVDQIPAKILKLSCNIIAPSLTYIFNQSITTGVFVDDWKRARVVPIYKSEDRRKCENYRPISILPVVSKLFEKEIFGQFYQYLINNSLLSRFQSGFRPKHSTLSLLIQMNDKWLENMDNGELTGLISVDIRKAFDSIDHKILLRKMQEQFGIQGLELNWFQSYLTKRSQVCVVNGHTSSAKEIICGVPQGSILGPLLFLLYINDLPECLLNTTPGMYADDTQIYASSANFTDLVAKLNKDLENIVKWLSQNKLQLHTDKTKLMFIGSPYNLKNKVGNDQVMINDKPVKRYTSFRCVGVELDEKLNWENHIDSIGKKAGSGIGIMKRVRPFVPYETLQNLYNSLVLPYFDYCSPLWDNCGSLLKEKLQKLQNRAARVMTGASYDIRSSDLLHAMSWKNLNDRLKINKAVLVYRILNGHSAPNLKDKFIRREANLNTYNLRNAHTDLSVPKPNTEYLKKSFGYSGAVLWNSLTMEAKLSESISSFKNLI